MTVPFHRERGESNDIPAIHCAELNLLKRKREKEKKWKNIPIYHSNQIETYQVDRVPV